MIQPEENAEFPDAITSLIGQTFMFGVYIEKDNATGGGVCYKVGKVWKDLSMLKICGREESVSAHTQGTINSSVSEVRPVLKFMFLFYIV